MTGFFSNTPVNLSMPFQPENRFIYDLVYQSFQPFNRLFE